MSRITIAQVRTRAENVNKRYGVNLSVERNYNYYNVYNGGAQIASGCRTAREAYNVVNAYECGLLTMQDLAAVRLPDEDDLSYKGESKGVVKGEQSKGWHDHDA